MPASAEPPPVEADPASPCTNICALDPATGACIGCGRTLDEIVEWGTASPDRKRAILARLASEKRASS